MNYELFKPLYDFIGIKYPGTYLTMLFFSFFMGFPILYFTAKKLHLTPWKQLLLPLAIVPFSLIFSRIFHIIFEGMFSIYMNGLKENGISYLFTVMLNPFKSGHVFYGGLLGGFLAGALVTILNYPKDWKKFLLTADSVSICVVNGLWLTRIGCFFEGCCFGRPSKLFGVHFPQGSRTMFLLYKIDPEHTSLFTETQPIIPTQLIHSASNLIILAILLKLMLTGKPKNPGHIAAVFMILYSMTRFFIEFLRYDTRGGFLFLSTSQWISIFLLFAGWKLYKYVKTPAK